MLDRKIVLISRQAGTANAFVPVIDQLQKAGYELLLLAFPNSCLPWREAKLKFNAISSFKDALKSLEEFSPNLVITGTSLEVKDDSCFWEWAQEKEIPSIAFVDSWVSYWERFSTSENDKFNRLPTEIAVVDELMKKRMVESGCSIDLLHITGNPSFDKLQNQLLHKDTSNIKSEWKEILYVSDPKRDIWVDDAKEIFGYDEYEVMAFLLDLLKKEAKEENKIKLFIKLHPRESSGKYQTLIQNCQSSFFQIEEDFAIPNSSIFFFDIVIGMNSILLYESALLGMRIVSLQPNRTPINNDITDFRNEIVVLNTYQQIEDQLPQMLKLESPKGDICHNFNATENFIHLISNQISINV
jgi:hypothetical protein